MNERNEAGPHVYSDVDTLVRKLLDRFDGTIRLALPLGLGKANTIANALTRAAFEDSSISLSIFTALTLETPKASKGLARRFLEPARDRLFGRYPNLLYAKALHDGALPPNIEVMEFFVLAGRWLSVEKVQQNHISANYTHALHYIIDRKPNVIAQLLARNGNGEFSLSCNTDISVDLLRARSSGKLDFVFAGEVNSELPFLPGTAKCHVSEIDLLLDDPDTDFELFSAVKRPISLQDQAIGLHVSRLVPDGGTLQIGIGSIGDAVARALQVRHENNELYRSAVSSCPFPTASDPKIEDRLEPFDAGLYAVSEMLVDGLLQLFESGIVKREVDGIAIHAAFFVESRDFYRRLREMRPDRLAKIAMMPVSYTNDLYGDQAEKTAARQQARFINNAMKATPLGAVISDSDENGRLVSGEGGQFNFVAQAFALPDARSIITLNATRHSHGAYRSNIVWEHPYPTVPRHFRDIVVSEYGIANLRGQSDQECVKSMLCITDSRFQPELLDQAKSAEKLDRNWSIPERCRRNDPERLEDWLRTLREGEVLGTFPFGTDFTETEKRLLPALQLLDRWEKSPMRLAALAWEGVRKGSTDPLVAECLGRMRLDRPAGFKNRMLAAALTGAIISTGRR